MNVFKYPLNIEDFQVISLPKKAEILCVVVQGTIPVLYARVDPEAPHENRLIRIAGTGHPKVEGKYISTFLISGGELVFHVFDLGEEE